MTPLEFLEKHTVSVDLSEIDETKPPVKQVDCDAFSTLLGIAIDDGVYMTERLADALTYGTAIAISTPLPGEPLWGFVVGPPSSSKTLVIDCISSNRTKCIPMTTWTGLHSGYQSDKEGKEDNSIVPLINGKCVCIKDFTAVMSAPLTQQEKLFGELRDFFDGSSHARFKNKRKSLYENVKFSFLNGVTDVVHKFNRSDLGERFLKIDVVDPHADHTRVTRTGMNTMFKMLKQPTGTKQIKFAQTRGATAGLIEYLSNDMAENGLNLGDRDEVHPEFQVYIDAISNLVAYARSNVLWEKDDLILTPRPEVNTRLSLQFLKFSACAGFVLKESYDSAEVRRLVKRIAFDTGHGFKLDILNLLGNHKHGMSIDEIAYNLKKPAKTIRIRMKDLYELRAVTSGTRTNGSARGGNKVETWMLTSKLQNIWSKVQTN